MFFITFSLSLHWNRLLFIDITWSLTFNLQWITDPSKLQILWKLIKLKLLWKKNGISLIFSCLLWILQNRKRLIWCDSTVKLYMFLYLFLVDLLVKNCISLQHHIESFSHIMLYSYKPAFQLIERSTYNLTLILSPVLI